MVLFTCYNLDKRYVLYDTYTKEVLRTEWISEHCGSKMEYGKPEAIPTRDYLETGFPSLFGLRDAKSFFIIDVREDGETYAKFHSSPCSQSNRQKPSFMSHFAKNIFASSGAAAKA